MQTKIEIKRSRKSRLVSEFTVAAKIGDWSYEAIWAMETAKLDEPEYVKAHFRSWIHSMLESFDKENDNKRHKMYEF